MNILKKNQNFIAINMIDKYNNLEKKSFQRILKIFYNKWKLNKQTSSNTENHNNCFCLKKHNTSSDVNKLAQVQQTNCNVQ